MAVKDWSETAASNTTINTINIAENCPFANMNDAVRNVMAETRIEVASQAAAVTAAAIATISGASQFKHLTGSTTITAFDTAVTGLYREMRASSALNLGNATALGLSQFSASLSLPTGSLVKARSLGAGNWAAFPERSDGLPLVRFWEEEQAAAVTAATIVDISATIPFGTLTGNTTVEGFSTAITGAYREIRVTGTPLLKHNGTSNIVPGSADLTLAAGDLLRSRSLGAGNWSHKVDKADGTAPASGSAAAGGFLRRTVYTSSDTWTKSADVGFVIVQVQAAGGGGGGASANGGGSGAGAGGYGQKKIAAGSLGATETVTINAAGTGGAAGANDGTNGGTASFGAHVTCNGGVKGLGGSSNARVAGGTGGTASSGDTNRAGQGGGSGLSAATNTVIIGGAGGSSELGSGGAMLASGGGVGTSTNGNAATGYGAGGGGGCAFGAGTPTGGNGTGGVIIVDEYSS